MDMFKTSRDYGYYFFFTLLSMPKLVKKKKKSSFLIHFLFLKYLLELRQDLFVPSFLSVSVIL